MFCYIFIPWMYISAPVQCWEWKTARGSSWAGFHFSALESLEPVCLFHKGIRLPYTGKLCVISCPLLGLIFVRYTCRSSCLRIRSERNLVNQEFPVFRGDPRALRKIGVFADSAFRDLQTEICCLTLRKFKQVLPDRFPAGTAGPLYHNSCWMLCEDNCPHIPSWPCKLYLDTPLKYNLPLTIVNFFSGKTSCFCQAQGRGGSSKGSSGEDGIDYRWYKFLMI